MMFITILAMMKKKIYDEVVKRTMLMFMEDLFIVKLK